MDVLIITGPVNQQQLRQPELSPGTRCIYVGSGGGTGSNDMHAAVAAWIGSKPLRSRVLELEPELERLGVIWFSAGHGGVRAMLDAGTEPGDVDAWLCLDGLYTAWQHQAQWATRLAEAAIEASTTLLATASTSTPGQYADSLSAWKVVMGGVGVSSSDAAKQTAVSLDLPPPDVAWQRGAMLVCGYEDIDHAHQTPAMRVGMAEWWNRVRTIEPPPPGPGPGDASSTPFIVGGAIAGAIAAAILLALRKRS